MNNGNEISILSFFFFLAKWLSQSFNWTILKKGRGRGPGCPPIFQLIKKATLELLILFTNVFISNKYT